MGTTTHGESRKPKKTFSLQRPDRSRHDSINYSDLISIDSIFRQLAVDNVRLIF